MPYSVLILTKNEEDNLPNCLNSVRICNDIVVLDSLSTDATVQFARKANARVFERKFDGYASQRNYALTQIQYAHPWVLILDADEVVPTDTHLEIEQAISAAGDDICIMHLRRRDHLYGRWIKRSSGYPTWFGRVARLGRVHVEREINEEYHTDGTSIRLKSHLDHFPFNKGLSAWISKHNHYSTMEAALKANGLETQLSYLDLVRGDAVRRRRAQKSLAMTLPGRPLMVFFALYLLRGGVLEGRAGFTFCCLRAFYEFMIDCKYRELLRRQRGLPV